MTVPPRVIVSIINAKLYQQWDEFQNIHVRELTKPEVSTSVI